MKRLIIIIIMMCVLVSLFPLATEAADNRQDLQSTPTVKACMACEDMDIPAQVEAVLFWMNGCPHCHDVLDEVLPPLEEKYGNELEIRLVEVSTQEDFNLLLEVAAAYGISNQQVGVPFLIIGENALIGSGEIPAELPRLIDVYLDTGGVSVPEIGAVQSLLMSKEYIIFQNSDSPSGLTPAPELTPTINSSSNSQESISSPNSEEAITRDGFSLAIGTMVLMAAAILISLIFVINGKTYTLPAWTDWLVPVLILVGIGVAGYLSYVETQPVLAVCGPVGDCNAVQSSPYARLFGLLPVGVLGLIGYLVLLAAWVVRKLQPEWEHPVNLIYWALVLFATGFSFYLTYLEPFVIHAVCMWCISSSVIATLLLLLGTPRAAVSLKKLGRG